MENELRHHLLRLTDAFVVVSGLQVSTLSQRAAGDWRFLSKLRGGGRFTVRKYDEVVLWFSENWPEGADWPSDVPRPASPPEDQEAA
ncbi:MAG: hypothetical protein B7X99_13610 [Rhizobiales bacterium 17-65-6]|nr:MAG: hypothetical protein B7X99_13610 [Rhizobiales bacterium 17-65-6]